MLVGGIKWRFEMTDRGVRARRLSGPLSGRGWSEESFGEMVDRLCGQTLLSFETGESEPQRRSEQEGENR